jgi:hypothetical protein
MTERFHEAPRFIVLPATGNENGIASVVHRGNELPIGRWRRRKKALMGLRV